MLDITLLLNLITPSTLCKINHFEYICRCLGQFSKVPCKNVLLVVDAGERCIFVIGMRFSRMWMQPTLPDWKLPCSSALSIHMLYQKWWHIWLIFNSSDIHWEPLHFNHILIWSSTLCDTWQVNHKLGYNGPNVVTGSWNMPDWSRRPIVHVNTISGYVCSTYQIDLWVESYWP
jgi:hypothetical protein